MDVAPYLPRRLHEFLFPSPREGESVYDRMMGLYTQAYSYLFLTVCAVDATLPGSPLMVKAAATATSTVAATQGIRAIGINLSIVGSSQTS